MWAQCKATATGNGLIIAPPVRTAACWPVSRTRVNRCLRSGSLLTKHYVIWQGSLRLPSVGDTKCCNKWLCHCLTVMKMCDRSIWIVWKALLRSWRMTRGYLFTKYDSNVFVILIIPKIPQDFKAFLVWFSLIHYTSWIAVIINY